MLNKLQSVTLLLVVFMSCGDLFAQRSTRSSLKKAPDPKEQKNQDGPKQMPIARVIALLRDEANKVYLVRQRKPGEIQKPWMHLTPNFSERWEVAVDEATVLKSMLRRLHPKSPVDAYIRLHLLSFKPNVAFGDDYASNVRKILASLPAIKHVPEPVINPASKQSQAGFSVSGTHQRYIKKEVPIPGTNLRSPVIQKVQTPTGKLGIGPLGSDDDPTGQDAYMKLAAQAKSMHARLLQEAVRTAFHNEPVIAYRDYLTDHFSDINIQFTLMLIDCRDRILAGHSSIKQASEKLRAMIQEVTEQNGLSPAQKRKWRSQVMKLKSLEKAVPVAIELEGHRAYVQRRAVRFPAETHEAIMTLLEK